MAGAMTIPRRRRPDAGRRGSRQLCRGLWRPGEGGRRGIEQLALLSLVPGETLNGLSRATGVQLIGRADVFGVLTAADVVDVTQGNSAGLYNPVGPPAKHGDGAFVRIDLNPVPT